MARRMKRDEIDDGPSEEDLERFGDVTQTCPSCGTTLYDDAEICWKCGGAVQESLRPGIPKWVLVTAGVLLAILAFVLLR